MATVVHGDATGEPRVPAARPEALVVSIAGLASEAAGVARIDVSVADVALARRLTRAMTRAVRAVVATSPREIAVLRVASRAALARLGARVAGAIVVVPVRAGRTRRVGELVDALRAQGAAGVQLVWTESGPPRGAAEASLFRVLEHARATPGRAPVVLARCEEPVDALRILVEWRR
jgi:hypothetical protein